MKDESESVQRSPPELLWNLAACLVIAACSWFLLRELAPLLRPLFLAIFLCYIIIPLHLRLTRYVPGPVSMVTLAVVSVVLTYLLALMIYGNIVELNEELPTLIERAQKSMSALRVKAQDRLPAWLAKEISDTATAPPQVVARIHQAVGALVNIAADVVTEAVLVGIYIIFLLLEARSMPRRIQSDFDGDRAGRILGVIRRINEAMASYLRVKVQASFLLGLPVTVLLWAFNVQFAVMWGVLTFFLNFIPYLGSVVACSLPILLAWLQLESSWHAGAVTVLLIATHMLSAYVVEPSMTGRAIGLSPLVILAALSFWSLCWGLIGMLLAVPLTVMFKIVLENLEMTRPYARLLSDDGRPVEASVPVGGEKA